MMLLPYYRSNRSVLTSKILSVGSYKTVSEIIWDCMAYVRRVLRYAQFARLMRQSSPTNILVTKTPIAIGY